MVAGNWKMNGNSLLVTEFVNAFNDVSFDFDVLICPPSPYLSLFKNGNLAIGGQDVSEFDSGAHTGDISTAMLTELGCNYVIVGHSERREDHGESNVLVALKAKAAINAGLVPLICVGEPLDVRESDSVEAFISAQLDALKDNLSVAELNKSVIAYEPIWAIGTGKTATPEQAQDVHQFIRGYFASIDGGLAQGLRILYGGSVKPDNAQTLFAQPDVDGGLIGGASLKVDDFVSICQAAN